MQKVIITLLLFTSNILLSTAQYVYYPYATPYHYSAGAGGPFTSTFNAAFNPSLIPFVKKFETAVYAEKKYQTDISVLLIAACVPFSNNGISLMAQRCGNTLFSENTFGLCYGKNLGALNVGIIFQHIRVHIHDAKTTSLIKTGVASLIKLTDNVNVSCRIFNPNITGSIGHIKLRSASSYSFCLGFEASREVYAAIESLKEEGKPFSLIFSLHYKLNEKFTGAFNWSTYTDQPYVAVSWQQKKLIIEAGCSYHPALGTSPTISLIYKKLAEK